MSALFWIQTVSQAGGIPKKICFEKKYWKKNPQTTKKHAILPSIQSVKYKYRIPLPYYACTIRTETLYPSYTYT